MPFVKLDCGILNSTLWFSRNCREVFITSLLMAEPFETAEPMQQFDAKTGEPIDWFVPPGWYGFVPAAGVGIISRAGLERDIGIDALVELGSPEPDSRSGDFGGRRLIRVNGGYVILNYMKYRERDYGSADRSRRYRLRKAAKEAEEASRRDVTTSRRDVTQAEAEAEAEGTPLRSTSVGNLLPSPSDRANGSDVLTKREEKRQAVRSLAAAATKAMPR